MSEANLHPALQKLAATHRRRLRLLGLWCFLAAAGLLMLVMVKAFTGQDAGSLLLLGLVGLLMLPMMAFVGGLMWYLDRRLARGLNDADRLLKECPPQDARLTPLGRGDGMGLLATVQLATEPTAPAKPLHALINPSFRWSAPPLGEIDVHLYCRELAPDRLWIALGAEGAPLIGRLIDRDAYRRRRLLLAFSLISLTFLVAAMAGVRLLAG